MEKDLLEEFKALLSKTEGDFDRKVGAAIAAEAVITGFIWREAVPPEPLKDMSDVYTFLMCLSRGECWKEDDDAQA